MKQLTLTEGRYLRAGEAFHFARRTLEPGPVRVLHDHDYFELFWIAGGRVAHLVNGVEAPLEAGDGVMIRPRDLHGFSPLGAEPCRLVNVMFRAETAAHLHRRYGDEIGDRYFWSRSAAPQGFRLDTARRNILDRWAADLEAGSRSLARIEGFLLGLLTQLVPDSPDAHSEIPPWLAGAIQAARRPEVFRLGAQGLIAAAGRSHEHVCRSVKTLLGTTPSALVNRMRMDHAARLLRGTDLSAADIAVECGLENMSHFHALFRQQFDVTPRHYRMTHQRDPVQPLLASSSEDSVLTTAPSS
jgi:AraC family cel operon transcriptional repressor